MVFCSPLAAWQVRHLAACLRFLAVEHGLVRPLSARHQARIHPSLLAQSPALPYRLVEAMLGNDGEELSAYAPTPLQRARGVIRQATCRQSNKTGTGYNKPTWA